MRPDRPAGFTLIEVLVAMIVTSLLLALVMNGAVSARERGARDRTRANAVILARSLLEEASTQPYQPGQRSGAVAALSWTLMENPIAIDPRGQVVLSEATVTIVGRDREKLFSGSLRTLKSLGS